MKSYFKLIIVFGVALIAQGPNAFCDEIMAPSTEMQMPDSGSGTAAPEPNMGVPQDGPTPERKLIETGAEYAADGITKLADFNVYDDGFKEVIPVLPKPDHTIVGDVEPNKPVVIESTAPSGTGDTIQISDTYPPGTQIVDGEIVDADGNPATAYPSGPDQDNDLVPDSVDSDPLNPIYFGTGDASSLPK